MKVPFILSIALLCTCGLAASVKETQVTTEGIQKRSKGATKAWTYPYQPGSSPPKGAKLPFTTGSMIQLQSDAYGLYCSVSNSSVKPAGALRCADENPEQSSGQGDPPAGFMVLGLDYTSRDLYDGDKIYLKNNKAGKFCSVGSPASGSFVTCKKMHYDESCKFVARVEGPDMISLTPADSLKAWCHPEADSEDAEETPSHPVRCGGSGNRRKAVFVVSPSGPSYPSGPGSESVMEAARK
ncbi:hypothetical protein CEUSTIGMA_g9323.t1 [Chlamydomonas eustigma]|uniref:Uncharacterized protein n=1 Tax=Chlamydomonas eustigma TaxID=1157962 RepID=A0A250XFP3_9CHLO|nr:hypothetical protein CEUSTIGMA_g9323.t1 [Chlamydomonas eustigma]|eukprot:GAX81895.1 hypothetical protein CEUSTIGMA_g9323.t1 [Chlamydomonas eustigma]